MGAGINMAGFFGALLGAVASVYAWNWTLAAFCLFIALVNLVLIGTKP